MMWNKQQSLQLSMGLVRALLIAIPLLACCVHYMVTWYDVVYADGVGFLGGSVYLPLSICLYIAAVFGEICLLHLMKLLKNIRKDTVFISENCRHLRILSWCCILVSIPFFVLGFWRFLSFIVAVAALFFGLILRVLKNVFDKAVELQDENNFTI